MVCHTIHTLDILYVYSTGSYRVMSHFLEYFKVGSRDDLSFFSWFDVKMSKCVKLL